MKVLEEGNELKLDFDKLKSIAATGMKVIPVAVQDVKSNEVILVAYINQEALSKAISLRKAVFWSTSRNELWIKGKESGNMYNLKEIRVNCEQNSLVFLVEPCVEGICHTRNRRGKARNCYYRRLDFDTLKLVNLDP